VEAPDDVEGLAKRFKLKREEAAEVIGRLVEAIRATDTPAQTIRCLVSGMGDGERKALLLGILLAEAVNLDLRGKWEGEEGYV